MIIIRAFFATLSFDWAWILRIHFLVSRSVSQSFWHCHNEEFLTVSKTLWHTLWHQKYGPLLPWAIVGTAIVEVGSGWWEGWAALIVMAEGAAEAADPRWPFRTSRFRAIRLNRMMIRMLRIVRVMIGANLKARHRQLYRREASSANISWLWLIWGTHNSPIYDECQTQSAWVLTLSRKWAHQDDSNNTPTTNMWVSSWLPFTKD